jgi:hypothetical protein
MAAGNPMFAYQGWRDARRLVERARAAAAVDGGCAVLTAPGGAGLSTLMRRLRYVLQSGGDKVAFGQGARPEAASDVRVLLVDDARLLDDTALMAFGEDARAGRFVLLAGDAAFAERVMGLGIAAAQVLLAPMRPAEAEQFVQRLLEQQGEVGGASAAAARLADAGEAWPGTICRAFAALAEAPLEAGAAPRTEAGPVVSEAGEDGAVEAVRSEPAMMVGGAGSDEPAPERQIESTPVVQDEALAAWQAARSRAHGAARARHGRHKQLVAGAMLLAGGVVMAILITVFVLNPGLRQQSHGVAVDVAPLPSSDVAPPAARPPSPPPVSPKPVSPTPGRPTPPGNVASIVGAPIAAPAPDRFAAAMTPAPALTAPAAAEAPQVVTAGDGETLAGLPALAPLRVQPAFERHDKHGKAAADALARRLDGQGVATSAPAVARRGLGPGIHYFYVEDRASVAELARRLGSAFEPVTLATGKAAEGQLPGAVIVVVRREKAA